MLDINVTLASAFFQYRIFEKHGGVILVPQLCKKWDDCSAYRLNDGAPFLVSCGTCI